MKWTGFSALQKRYQMDPLVHRCLQVQVHRSASQSCQRQVFLPLQRQWGSVEKKTNCSNQPIDTPKLLAYTSENKFSTYCMNCSKQQHQIYQRPHLGLQKTKEGIEVRPCTFYLVLQGCAIIKKTTNFGACDRG